MNRKPKFSLVCLLIIMMGSLLLLNFVGHFDLTAYNQMCFAIDVIEINISGLLIYGFELEKFENIQTQKISIVLLWGEIFLFISDMLARYFLGCPNVCLIYLVCTIPLLLVIVEVYLYWVMIVYTLEDRSLEKYSNIMKGIGIVYIIFVILNIPFHYMFTVSSSFYDQRSVIYYISYLGPASMFTTMVYAVMHADPYKEIKRLLYYIILPFFICALSQIDMLVYTGLLCSMTLIYIDFHYNRQLNLLKNKQLSLEKERDLQEYSTKEMISQIQPHFIYNTFGAISMLCELDPMKAKEVTIQFAQYFRSNINALNQQDVVSFHSELDHIRNYVYLENIRFDDLDVEINIESEDFMVPCLSIQPLVENAIKHGIMAKEEGGKVTIEEKEKPQGHVITIKDDGAGFDIDNQENSYGGIYNSKSRIEMMVKGNLDVESIPGLGTIVKITIPYE